MPWHDICGVSPQLYLRVVARNLDRGRALVTGAAILANVAESRASMRILIGDTEATTISGPPGPRPSSTMRVVPPRALTSVGASLSNMERHSWN